MPTKKVNLGQKPDGTYDAIQLDSSGNLKTTGGSGGGGGDVVITDGVDSVTITNNSGKYSLDVNVTDITISKLNDSIATESFDQSLRVDEASSTVTYFGFADVGSAEGSSVWKIKRLSVTGTVTKIEYADGNINYDNNWSNRASLSYS